MYNIMNFVTVMFGLTMVSASVDRTEILIQAEDMLLHAASEVNPRRHASGRAVPEVSPRRHASGQKSVHLFTGDSLQTEVCFLPDTKLTLNEIRYSNDGPSDRVRISLDKLVLDELVTDMITNGGFEWDVFKSHYSRSSTVTEGRHILTVTVLKSDEYGVEIDFIKFSVNNSQTMESITCKSFCFEDVTGPYCIPTSSPSGRARAVQRSVQTKCTEEDNIHIPVFHESSSTLNFVVTASLPKYRSFLNNREPDWTNCKMAEAFWRYKDISLSIDETRQAGKSRLHITQVTPGISETRHVRAIEVNFELEGPSAGSTDSEIGTQIHLQNVQYDDSLAFQFQYYNRYNIWSDKQEKSLKKAERNVMFETPDFSFREGKGNKIRIEVFSDLNSLNSLTVGEFHMYKRPLKPDRSKTLYNDGVTVIEGVDIDMWWRINETMSVTIKDEKQTFNDVDYIRISRRVPWAEHGFSEIFVLYQDANIRLLPTTPHGLDYIPFGSSVIIGQTDPLSNRPCAPITHLDIDPNMLEMTIYFMDSNVVTLKIKAEMSETQVHVSDSYFVRDVNLHPFFTFRSMYVADDNNDVELIRADDGIPQKINEQWKELRGNFFAFYRQQVSKHNTQSPDISIRIISLS